MSAGNHAVRRRKLAFGVAGALLVFALAAVLFSCSQTPTSVPVRTFERAQRMDVACLRLYDPPAANEAANLFHPREPIGRPQSECQPVPSNLDGQGFDKQLFAFVTQTTRGELAVVDLSAGKLVDQSRATPGINFIPVGARPTDVAASPDGKMVFVASAEANKPAIYGIPTRRILGDTSGFPRDPDPVTLGSWPVCALPQNPGAITIVPRRAATAGGDAGADAGAAGGELAAQYDIVVVLPGDRQSSAKILTIDPRPFRRGGLARDKKDPTKRDYASDLSGADGEVATLNDGPVLEPGQLKPCADYLVSAVELVGANAVPTSFVPGPKWDDGVKYVDGGVDLTCKRPAPAESCGLPPCCAAPAPSPDGGSDAGADAAPEAGAGACEPLGPKDAGAIPLNLGPLDPPRLVAMARDEQTIFIADEGAPLIHVLDLSTPSAPRELPPFLATTLADPSRAVRIKDLAISPPTRDYKRFLYAVDATDGSILVYDATDLATAPRTPQLRPHPELNPFQPADRIAFSSPVVALAFARHDLPLSQLDGVAVPSAASGLLCNPNKNVESDPRSDLGSYYRADKTDPGQSIGPRRLRGIFAFATLASGQVITINVDDWDSPCRRPFDMTKDVSDVALAQPAPSGPSDKDPYHAPTVTAGAVTNEAFFPMSAPHTLRSEVLITNDSISGNQLPRIVTSPVVNSNGVILPQVGPGSDDTPSLSVRFSLDEAQVHIDQDWLLVYEPAIPGFDGISAPVVTRNNYASIVLDQPQARFCTKGVEDWARGSERTKIINGELAKSGKSLPAGAERWMTDYVQLTEDLLDVSDDYWGLDQSKSDQSCWEGPLASASGATRHDACARTYGSLASDEKPTRDFPIVEAYDDHVVLGRFYTPKDGHREVVYTDPSNASDLKLMQCCFHHQVRFRVRTGQLWTAIGQSVGGGVGLGVFSHMTSDSAGRCVSSCDPRESLLNSRLPTLPPGIDPNVDKNSPIALRNPMFAAVLLGAKSGKEPVRDMFYGFSTRGQFRTLAVSIGGSSIRVNPQSMKFIDSLGQMAVVDGDSQGLVLIDLQAVTVARAPYF
ncbi:hypothetical protein BH11MYX4_BH11MYX4_27210 [soil metagenome]